MKACDKTWCKGIHEIYIYTFSVSVSPKFHPAKISAFYFLNFFIYFYFSHRCFCRGGGGGEETKQSGCLY